MRIAGDLRWLAAVAAVALAPSAWANPSWDAGSDDRWAMTVIVGVFAGLLLVWLGDRRRSRSERRVSPLRLAVILVGAVAVVVGVEGFFRGRPVEPAPGSIPASSGDPASGPGDRLRFGVERSGVEWRHAALVAPGLVLIALGAWPRKRRPDLATPTARRAAAR